MFIWNTILYSHLPAAYGAEVFWKDIPTIVSCSENVLRIIIFGLPVIMIFSLKTKLSQIGFKLYLTGVLIYFSSWLLVIIYPDSGWSTSLPGFLAPAYTTLIWFVGIGLIGNKSFFKFPHLSKIYIAFSIIFVAVHTLHVYIVFQKL